MSELHHPRRWWRSVAALLLGFLVVVVLSLGTDIVLHAFGIFPRLGQPMSDALCMLATAYRTVYGVAGSYITARFAPDRPMQHALAGGVVGLALSTVGAVVTWDRGPAFGPHWYPLALIATAMPCAWAGGRLLQLRAGPTSQGVSCF
jgi:drug/metabolite transporter (DMT)-like permease